MCGVLMQSEVTRANVSRADMHPHADACSVVPHLFTATQLKMAEGLEPNWKMLRVAVPAGQRLGAHRGERRSLLQAAWPRHKRGGRGWW